MTLVLSLRTGDGIVLAADSLTTVNASREIDAEAPVACPGCQARFLAVVRGPAVDLPVATLPTAEKILPFMGRYGVAYYNVGRLAGGAFPLAMGRLEARLAREGWSPGCVGDVAERIGEHVRDLAGREVADLDRMPDDWVLAGFHVNGYDGRGDGAGPVTVDVRVGRKVACESFTDRSILLCGEPGVARLLVEGLRGDGCDAPMLDLFNLRDAIGYADFLVRATADCQRFSRRTPSVGGPVDVAVVTPSDGFRWVRRKPLAPGAAEAA